VGGALRGHWSFLRKSRKNGALRGHWSFLRKSRKNGQPHSTVSDVSLPSGEGTSDRAPSRCQIVIDRIVVDGREGGGCIPGRDFLRSPESRLGHRAVGRDGWIPAHGRFRSRTWAR